jgi:hypothetical protein
MKKVIVLFVTIIFFFLTEGCKKKNIETPEQTKIQAITACMNGKTLPDLPRQDTYIEGEIDGKHFGISKNAHTTVRSTLKNFLAAGYQKQYAYNTEWQGNGFAAFPIDTVDIAEYHYYIEVNFSSFRGDSLEYMRYFDQFQKGNNFTFRKKLGDMAEAVIPKTVSFEVTLFQCDNDLVSGGSLNTESADQTNSYFRIADVKNYVSPSGEIYKRDVTIEFDVSLGTFGKTVKRIKNGRIFFSY